ncbi:MAG: DNA primase [Tepidisphaeraceae bacterium]|jgi:DNA primase
MASDVRAQILQATDLVELIGQTVALKRRGKTYAGLCPFHNEKTPSFHVNPARQYFTCFGCKASGTAFDFIMLRDRVDFRQAMEILARQAGIEIPHFGGEKFKPGERQLLLDLHQAAARFFENQLSLPLAATAREYLAKRGFTADALKKFCVGLAPVGWDNLLKSEVGRKFGTEALTLGGLVKARDNGSGHYDTFRNRIMFPIRNESGQIIAFGGRVVPGSEDPAKYLNSPETPLFSKSRAIFGIDLAKQRIVETRTVSVVEGYTDVMMSHQFGATNVVSPLGTALTEQHVHVLRRFADRIVLLFDADSAGDDAVNRVVQLFLTQPVDICVATMPQGLDPDEFFLKFGVEAFDKMIVNASDALTYAWTNMLAQLQAAEGDLVARERATRQYLELLSKGAQGGTVDPIRWGTALARVGRLTGIPVEELHRRFKPQKGKTKPIRPPVQNKPNSAPSTQDSAPGTATDHGLLTTDSATTATDHGPLTTNSGPVEDGPITGSQLAQRQIIGALLIEPSLWNSVQVSVNIDSFAQGSLRRLAESYWNHQLDEGEPVLNEFLASLGDPELVNLAIELVQSVEQMADLKQTVEGAICFLREDMARTEQRQMHAQALEVRDASFEVMDDLLRRTYKKAGQPDLRRPGF